MLPRFIILLGLTMTWFSEKMLISTRWIEYMVSCPSCSKNLGRHIIFFSIPCTDRKWIWGWSYRLLCYLNKFDPSTFIRIDKRVLTQLSISISPINLWNGDSQRGIYANFAGVRESHKFNKLVITVQSTRTTIGREGPIKGWKSAKTNYNCHS